MTSLAAAAFLMAAPTANAVEPNVSWSPADITYGDTIGDNQLNPVFTDPDTGNTVQGFAEYEITSPGALAGQSPSQANNDAENNLVVANSPVTLEVTFIPESNDFDPVKATRSFAINQKQVRVTAPRVNRFYGSNAQTFADNLDANSFTLRGTVFNQGLDDVFPGDNPSLNADLGNVSSSPAGTTVNITFAATPNPNPNYTVRYEAGALTIIPKDLEIAVVNTSTRFGQEINLAFQTSEPQADLGFENDEDENFSLVFVADFLDGNTANTAVGSYNVGLALNNDGIDNDQRSAILSNYNLSLVDGTHNVNQRRVTITGQNNSKTYGENNPTFRARFDLQDEGTFDLDLGQNLGQEGNFLNRNNLNNALGDILTSGVTIGNNLAGGPTGLSAGDHPVQIGSGTAAAGFNLVRESGTLTVNKRPIRIFADNKVMQFQSERLPSPLTFTLEPTTGDTDPNNNGRGRAPGEDRNVILTTTPSLQYTSTIDGQSTNPDDGQIQNISVGTYGNAIIFTTNDEDVIIGAVNSNYTIAKPGDFVTGSLEVIEKLVNFTWNPNVQEITYGNQVSMAATLNADSGGVAGEIQYEARQISDGNGNGNFPAGENVFSDSFQVIKPFGSNNFSDPNGGDLWGPGFLPAGTYQLRATFQPDDEDQFRTATLTRTFSVQKRRLTISAFNETRNFDEANPEFDISFGNFAFVGEGSDNLESLPTASTTATPSTIPGNYEITLSGGNDENYRYDLVNGTLTIVKDLEVTTNGKSRVFGQAIKDVELRSGPLEGVSGLVAEDEDNVSISYKVDFDAIGAGNKIGDFIVAGSNYPINVMLNDPDNRLQFYNISFDDSGNGTSTVVNKLTINKAPLEAIAEDKSQGVVVPEVDDNPGSPTETLTVVLNGLVGPHSDLNGESKSLGGWENENGIITDNSTISVRDFDQRQLQDFAIDVNFQSDNYDVSNVNGTYTVQTLTPDIAVDELTYGQELTLDTLNPRITNDPNNLLVDGDGNPLGTFVLANPPSGSFPNATDTLTLRMNYTPPEDLGFRSVNNQEVETTVHKQKIIVNADHKEGDDAQTYGEPTPELTFSIFRVQDDWTVRRNDDGDKVFDEGLLRNDEPDQVFQPALVLTAAGPATGHRPVEGQLKTDGDGNTFVQPFYDITFGQRDPSLANYDVRYNRALLAADEIDGDLSDEDDHPDRIGRLRVDRRPLEITVSPTEIVQNDTPPVFTNPFSDKFVYQNIGFAPNEGPGVLKGELRAEVNPDAARPLTVQGSPYDVVFTSRAFADNYVINYTRGTLTVAPAEATIELSNLSQRANGDPKLPTVTTTPSGLATDINFVGLDEAPSEPGSYPFTVTITDPNFSGSVEGTLNIIGGAGILITETTKAFDGSPKEVTVLTSPSGLETEVTYDGSTTPPTQPGRYEVVARIIDPNFDGTATGTFTITGPADIEVGGLQQSYDGEPKAVSVTTDPSGLNTVVTYDGQSTPPTEVGTYNVVVQIQDPVFTGETVVTMEITKANAGILISNTSQGFDGDPKEVDVQTSPEGLDVTTTYNGETTPPTGVGEYAVEVSVSDDTYQGTATGSLTITKGNQTITFPEIGDKTLADSPVQLQATASSGLEIQYQVLSGNATVSNSSLSLNAEGTVVVAANQPGNENWNAADRVLRAFEVIDDGQEPPETPVSVSVTETQATVSLNLDANVQYVVEHSPSLTNPNWEVVGTVAGDGSITYDHGGAGAGYFRVQAAE